MSPVRVPMTGTGACLLRTDDPADPQAWRAWDRRSFPVRFFVEPTQTWASTAYDYPALLDPDSRSADFDEVGRTACV